MSSHTQRECRAVPAAAAERIQIKRSKYKRRLLNVIIYVYIHTETSDLHCGTGGIVSTWLQLLNSRSNYPATITPRPSPRQPKHVKPTHGHVHRHSPAELILRPAPTCDWQTRMSCRGNRRRRDNGPFIQASAKQT